MMPNTRVCVAGAFDHAIDREAGEDRAEAVTGSGKTCRKATAIREPTHHQADDADIDDAGAKAADDPVREVQRPDIVDIGRQHPAAA
jgi:hypothetical protein